MTRRLLTCIIAGMTALHCSATGVIGDTVVTLQPVVTTATRTPKLVSDAPLLTRVISEQDIKKTDATNIQDLLTTLLPGFEFTYSMDQQTTLRMQGFGGNAILFLVDGERLAGETLDNVDYYRLTLDNVERIEVVKGAASALYGSNAVGAIVNIITKNPDKRLSANVNARYGSHEDQRYGASVGTRQGRWTSNTSVQHTHTDNIDLKRPGDFERIFANKTWNAKEKVTWQPTDQVVLTGNASYFFRERSAEIFSHDRYRDLSANAKAEYTPDNHHHAEVAYIFDEYDKSDYLLNSKKDLRDYANVQNSVRALYSYATGSDCTLPATVTVGGDFMRDYLISYQFAEDESHRQYDADLYAQIDANPTTSLNTVAAIRYDHFSETGINHLSAKAALMYKWEKLKLRASYAGGFKAPSLKEMYMNFNMANIFDIYGNKDLKAEKSDNFQLSAEYIRRNYYFSATGFYNLFDHKITTVWDQNLKGMRYVNTRQMQIAGVEANASARYANGIGWTLSYVYTHEHINKNEPQIKTTRPHAGVANIDYQRKWKDYGLNVSLAGRFLSKLNTEEYSFQTAYETTEKRSYPGYQMWKVNIAQQYKDTYTLTLTVDNLLNYRPDYYHNNSPATTGTTFYVGLSVDLDHLF